MELEFLTIKELMKNGVERSILLKICEDLYKMTSFLSEDYPQYRSWFYKKQIPETINENSNRDIIFARDKNNVYYGTCFIKNDETEKKICSIFVCESVRKMGIGTKLFEKSFEILQTTKPMITIKEYKLPYFKNFITKYEWKQTQVIKGIYNSNHSELVFNGILNVPIKNEKINKIEEYDLNNDNIIIISILTYYANQILNGTKIFEFRKSPLKSNLLNKPIYIYSAKNDKAIVGKFKVDKILHGNSDEIIKLTGFDKRADKDEIINYFGISNKNCYALHLIDIEKFETPLSIKELKVIDPQICFPQYYGYINNKSPLFSYILNYEKHKN